MACSIIVMMKTQQNFGSWLKERITCWIREAEIHIRLPGQLTANYFTDRLKESKE